MKIEIGAIDNYQLTQPVQIPNLVQKRNVVDMGTQVFFSKRASSMINIRKGG